MTLLEAPPRPRAVRVLDEDPDLAARLDPTQIEPARRSAIAAVASYEPGPIAVPPSLTEPGAYGLLVIDGLIGLRMSIPERCHLELIGPSDVVRPWVELGPWATVPSAVRWEAMVPTRVAVLDRRYAASIARWPELCAALMNRLVLRSRRMAFQLAVVSIPRTEDRLLLSLWQLADRFGRVTREGVHVPFPLTHQNMADMISTRRPSVTNALVELSRDGRVVRRSDRTWLLCGGPPDAYTALRERSALPVADGAL